MKKTINSSVPYLKYLEAANDCFGGVGCFCFYPGMLFKSEKKWWPDAGTRPTRHEGIDICYYKDRTGTERQFTPHINIPVMTSGRVFAICPDFLGYSVFVDHEVTGPTRLLSVYAHIIPTENLTVGVEVMTGYVVGKVADTKGRKNRMPAHLHISILEIPDRVAAAGLDWGYICNSNEVTLFDPLSIINCEMVRIYQENHWKEQGMRL